MKIDRPSLVAILKKLAPALHSKDLVPALACFCFAADSVHAYDDTCGLTFPAKLGITGGVRGELLLSFLNASHSKMADVTPGDGSILFRAGRDKLETQLLPEDDFLFTAPKLEGATPVKIDGPFLVALTRAALSMGRDASTTWRYGVTCVPHAAGYALYATDAVTVTRAVVGKLGTPGELVLLPPRFVDLLLAQSKDDAPKRMSIAEQWCEVKFQSGLKLFTRTVTGAAPEKYDALLEQINETTKGLAVEIPKGLQHCLERAQLVVKYSKEPHTRVTADGTNLRFETKSAAGDVRGSVLCGHAAAEALVPPELILRGLPHAEKIAIVSECVKLSARGYTFLACTHQTGKETAGEPETEDAGEMERGDE